MTHIILKIPLYYRNFADMRLKAAYGLYHFFMLLLSLLLYIIGFYLVREGDPVVLSCLESNQSLVVWLHKGMGNQLLKSYFLVVKDLDSDSFFFKDFYNIT